MTKGKGALSFKIFSLIVSLAFVFSCLSLSSCAKKHKAGAEFIGDFLSSEVWLVVSDEIEEKIYAETIDECSSLVAAAENALSTEISTSDVSRYNALRFGESVLISDMTAAVIASARAVYEKTDGAFDPTVYPLVDLWGFSARFDARYAPRYPFDREKNADGSLPLPDEKYLSAFKELVDFSKVGLIEDDNGFYLKKNCPSVTVDGEKYEQKIDLSGIAKGYLAQRLVEIVDKKGIKNYYLSLGTSSVYLGEGKAWNTELTDPSDESRAAFAKASLSGTGVTTSGTYENEYTLSGRKYHHVIDVTTGESAKTDILSVTVVGTDLAFADALSTALVAVGYEKALDIIRRFDGFKYVFVLAGGEVFSDIPLTLMNEKYSLKAI